MFGRSKAKGNYAYTATKAKAMKSQLIKEDDYNKMLQLNVTELVHFVSEAGYSKEISEIGERVRGIDLIERATYANMAFTFKKLLDGSQGELHTVLAAYLQKWDNWNIKVILRGKSYGLSADQIKDDLVPAGSMGAEALDKLIALESTDEIIAAYEKAESLTIPPEVLHEYHENGNLGKIEDFIDKYQYERLLKVIPNTSIPTRMFSDYIRETVDIKNVETIMKLKSEGIIGDAVMEYIIPGGKQVDMKLAKQLADAEKVTDTIADLAQLDFYEDVKDDVESGEMDICKIFQNTKKHELHVAKKFSSEYPLSVLPVVDYMINMENEARNIRTIARGIESGIDRETIKELLVI